MNKLAGIHKLSSAFWHIQENSPLSKQGAGPGDSEALEVLAGLFNWLRRSLRMEDLKPVPKCAEGYNGRMPTQL